MGTSGPRTPNLCQMVCLPHDDNTDTTTQRKSLVRASWKWDHRIAIRLSVRRSCTNQPLMLSITIFTFVKECCPQRYLMKQVPPPGWVGHPSETVRT